MVLSSQNERAKAFVSKLDGVSEKTAASIGVEMGAIPRLILNDDIASSLMPSPNRPALDWSVFNTSKAPLDVIIDIPGTKLKLCAPLVRVLVTQLVKTLSLRQEKTHTGAGLPNICIMLDEFPQLQRTEAVVDAMATLRSKGVTIAIAIQSLNQLENIYGRSVARSVLEMCSYKLIFNALDADSQAYLSALIGTADVRSVNISVSAGSKSIQSAIKGATHGTSLGRQSRPIVYPEFLAYLKDPILLSPYGVCTVKKGRFFPHETELDAIAENVSDLTATVKQIQMRLERETSAPVAEIEHGGNYDFHRDDLGDDTLSNGDEAAVTETMRTCIRDFCAEARSMNEIKKHFNFPSSASLRETYITPLISEGFLKMSHPDTPTHPHQKYLAVGKEVAPAEDPSAVTFAESFAESNDVQR